MLSNVILNCVGQVHRLCLMEKDFRSLLLNQQRDVQLLNVKSSAQRLAAGLQHISTPLAAPVVNNAVSTNGNYPIAALPLPAEAKEPHGWFYYLPRFRQGFVSAANMVPNEKPLPGIELAEKVPATTVGYSAKQFLVFDQSGDKTTLIYSSGIGTPLCLNSWNSNSKPPAKCNDGDTGKFRVWSETHNLSGPSLTDEQNANYSEAEDNSEMREDTEEINALLYSDDESAQDEDDSDEDVSTGHSPSLMTAYNGDKEDIFEVEDGEEVASSGGPTKRQRISEDGWYAPSLADTASSAKPVRAFPHDDDAESNCADDHMRFVDYDSDMDSMRGMKRSRKERIRETVEILQSIIPGGQAKGIDAAMVLDESIRYLKSLIQKAKSLGLSAL